MVYKRTKEHTKKILESRKNYRHSDKTKKKISLSHKGLNNWSKGKKQTKEWIKKRSKALTGKKASKQARENISKAHIGIQAGDKHLNWQGGISKEPYSIEWTKTLKRSIRERDKYSCRLCNEQQTDRAFDIHHIDYDKKNCNPNNLITLCKSCHMKTNYEREYWINYFKLLKI